VETQYQEAVLLDAQRRCRKFTNTIVNILPRELRDMVYDHAWDYMSSLELLDRLPELSCPSSPSSRSGEATLADTVSQQADCKGKFCQCVRWRADSIWLQPRFVGLEVAREAAASYWRAVPPDVIEFELESLGNFLLTDHLHLNVKPADHIRRLELTIEPTELDGLSSIDAGLMEIRYLPVLKWYLQPLLQIRLKRGLKLRMAWGDSGLALGSKLEAIRSIIRPLKDAGAHIAILAPLYGNRRHHDISDFYDMPLLEWQAKWEARTDADLDRESGDDFYDYAIPTGHGFQSDLLNSSTEDESETDPYAEDDQGFEDLGVDPEESQRLQDMYANLIAQAGGPLE
jgi:hypothetical protein